MAPQPTEQHNKRMHAQRAPAHTPSSPHNPSHTTQQILVHFLAFLGWAAGGGMNNNNYNITTV